MDIDTSFRRENSVEADPVLRDHLDRAWQKVFTTQLTARLERLKRTESHAWSSHSYRGYSRESSLEPVGLMSATPSPTSSRTASPRPESIFSIDSIDSIDSNMSDSSKESSYSPICLSEDESNSMVSSPGEMDRLCGRERRRFGRWASPSAVKPNRISKSSKRKSRDHFTTHDNANSMWMRSRSRNGRRERMCTRKCRDLGHAYGCREKYRELCVT